MAFRHFVGILTGEEAFSKLRVIRLASETGSKQDVELYKKHFSSDCILVNGLSSSETVTIRQYFIDKDTEITTQTVPVGYPLADHDVRLLDHEGQEVGFNQVGEVAVRSSLPRTRQRKWTRKSLSGCRQSLKGCRRSKQHNTLVIKTCPLVQYISAL
jgi:acyl-coenzyme A synthetase/AMP-(fatty) acid ligase